MIPEDQNNITQGNALRHHSAFCQPEETLFVYCSITWYCNNGKCDKARAGKKGDILIKIKR